MVTGLPSGSVAVTGKLRVPPSDTLKLPMVPNTGAWFTSVTVMVMLPWLLSLPSLAVNVTV